MAGSVLAAAGWGAVLGGLPQGVPVRADSRGPTPRLPAWLVVPLLPALLGFQLMSWWVVFCGRINAHAPVSW